MNKRIINYKGQNIEALKVASQGGWVIWINDVTHFGSHKTMRAAHSYARGYINRHPEKFAVAA